MIPKLFGHYSIVSLSRDQSVYFHVGIYFSSWFNIFDIIYLIKAEDITQLEIE